MRFSPSANSRQATLPGALPRIALQPCDMFSRILARSWNPVMALLPQCGTAEDAIHFSEVWNLLIHKRTANRIFSTTFSIFFFYQKYIHTHIFPQTGVDLNPTRFLILIPTMSKRILRSAQILVRWLVSANYGTSHDL